jgi:hypothetical protein
LTGRKGRGGGRLPAHPLVELIFGEGLTPSERIVFLCIEVPLPIGRTSGGGGDARGLGGLTDMFEDPLNGTYIGSEGDDPPHLPWWECPGPSPRCAGPYRIMDNQWVNDAKYLISGKTKVELRKLG